MAGFSFLFRRLLTPEDLVAPFVGHGELPAGQLALAEDIFAAQGRARGDGTGQGARQYGVDEAGCLYPLIVAVQHQPPMAIPLPTVNSQKQKSGTGVLALVHSSTVFSLTCLPLSSTSVW